MSDKREKPKLSWEPRAAFACFSGSVLSLALGFALTTEWVVNAERHPVMHAIGLTGLIIGIPLLILGGHCLDLMERKVKKLRQQLGRAPTPVDFRTDVYRRTVVGDGP